MGYEAYSDEQSLEIVCATEAEVIDACRAAGVDVSTYDPRGARDCETVQELLESFGFHFGDYGAGFQGKWRNQEEFFDALAPFVKDDSYLHFVGEDGDRWGFVFRGGKCIRKQASIVWTEAV